MPAVLPAKWGWEFMCYFMFSIAVLVVFLPYGYPAARGEIWPAARSVTGSQPAPTRRPAYVTIAGIITGPTVNEYAVVSMAVDVDQWPTTSGGVPPKNPGQLTFTPNAACRQCRYPRGVGGPSPRAEPRIEVDAGELALLPPPPVHLASCVGQCSSPAWSGRRATNAETGASRGVAHRDRDSLQSISLGSWPTLRAPCCRRRSRHPTQHTPPPGLVANQLADPPPGVTPRDFRRRRA